jgi:hypothetical protein
MPLWTIFTKCPAAGGKRGERRLEQRDCFALTADHQAVALLQTEHAAAGADVEVADAGRAQLVGAADVIVVVGVSAIDQHVAPAEQRAQLGDHRIDQCRRHHDPHGPRRRESAHQLRRAGGRLRAVRGDRAHRRGGAVVRHALMAGLQQPTHHVGAHAPESDHPYAHCLAPR